MAKRRTQVGIGNFIMQVFVVARPASREKILHVKSSRVRATLGSFIGYEFIALAPKRLKASFAHCRPAFGTVQKVAHHNVQRCALAGDSYDGSSRTRRRSRP